MKMPKVDVKKIAMTTAGEGVGLFALQKVSEIAFVAKQSGMVKGLIYKGLGAIVLPMLAGKAKKGSELVDGAASALSLAGTSQIINSFNKKDAVKPLVPAIGGYEDSPISGDGYEFEEGVDGPNDDDDDDDVMS